MTAGTPSHAPRPGIPGTRRARRKASVAPARFRAVALRFPADARPPRRPVRTRLVAGAAVLAFATVVGTVTWLGRPRPTAPPAEEVFLFEEIPPPPPEPPPPPPDPDPPPPPPPVAEKPEPPPPPQFGLQEEAVGEAGELEVAAGNTLMMEADTVTKEPVEDLPQVPQLVDQPPRVLKGRPPEYPLRALERGIEGTVIALATIDTLGRVTSVEIERSGGRYFDDDVLRAVRRLVFQPVIRDGRRIPVRVRLPYDFRLE